MSTMKPEAFTKEQLVERINDIQDSIRGSIQSQGGVETYFEKGELHALDMLKDEIEGAE